ncbi:intracellular protein transport protein USO1-like [Teratosphaeria destructans]|uniref:Intracellular protein transport protein USO1-like n=1 Tax=Teratosphaeria destructans TaxID=418781 RepID=A0A9W7SP37_9PEZI|nr:intracellular protein transport protein USO1-like [Teratosphaeria destructans]
MLKTPPMQTATATIETLCGRLQSATLLEDRRGAIQGLRSFAKQYPASVASGSLRELIAILRRDGLGDIASSKGGEARKSDEGAGDVDTIRLVLETLLMLFNPDSSSPEASDEIAFFMADEFSMRQDNITLLLNLLNPTIPYADYYSRLYSVQLLQAICAARPERLQECILSAPLGVSRLVGVLDDTRDAVRSAGLLLLVDLTSGANEDLRKIVAFEDVFGKVFAIIRAEGGLGDAGVVAQDCLSLLNNLIKGSASNQTMFRESGCVNQMTQLLQDAFPPSEPEAAYVQQGRERAAWGLLQLLTSFLEPGEKGTPQNQHAFFRAGISQVLIDLGFTAQLPSSIRTVALKDASALIHSNAPLQEAFAALTIELPSKAEASAGTKPPAQTNGTLSAPHSNKGSARPSAESSRTYIIEALLDLTLSKPEEDSGLRTASCNLIQAYLTNHDRIKEHFLNRAISGHAQHEDAANVLNTLLIPGAEPASVVYASWIVADLTADSPDAKNALAVIKEGNEAEGEDVLTAIQAMGTQLQSALQSGDQRLVAAYVNLLTTLLWDFAEGVNNVLAEGSALLQALVAAVDPAGDSLVITGLAAVLLGIVYEFSTKDSPIPRRTLAPLLTEKLGRSKYLGALSHLRRHPAVRDFDFEESEEEALLSKTFIDLFLVEYTRLRRAIDKDPGIEVIPVSAVEAGVDRDILDDLRQQIQAAKDALAQAQQDAMMANQQHEQDRMSVAKELQTANAEVERLRKINQAMQAGHESDVGKLARQHEQKSQQLQAEHQRVLASMKQEAEQQAQTRLREQGAAAAQKAQEYERRLVELGNAHRSEQQKHADAARQLESLQVRHAELSAKEKTAREQLADLQQRHAKIEREHQQLQTRAEQAESELEKTKAESETRQNLNTRLLAQVKELRDELAGREEELKAERAGFGELEKELEATKSSLATAEQTAADSTKKAAEAEKKVQDAEAKVKTLQSAADKSAKSGKGGKGANAQQSKAEAEKIAKLEKEIQEAKEGEKSAKEELDSMLLVMGDIETKRDEYKAKIKQLGGEVTEDEGEDEDEDDGEEEVE